MLLPTLSTDRETSSFVAVLLLGKVPLLSLLVGVPLSFVVIIVVVAMV